MSPVIKPISVVLKEARQNKGVSLDEAYKATKIHPNILRALEDGTTLGLSHIYVKSYIRIYAKYLGINRQELDKYFQPIAPKEKKVILDFPLGAKGDRIKSLPKLLILSNLPFQIKRFKKIIVALVIFLILALLGIPKCVHRRDVAPLEKAAKKKLSSVSQIKETKIKPREAKEAKVEKEPLSKIDDVLRLTISAKEDTWIEVKKDRKVVFTGILHKFTSETWQAKDSLELRIANAGTVELELNGKILPPIGRKGQSLKKVIITKEGLSIKK